ncbi:MAG: hypothetical protein J6D30_04760 [Clostridia bacterium]|nr:hypothetical protein [Clostridia bacterium]
MDKKNLHREKKRLTANDYISIFLGILIMFWSIAGVLGIIAFARTSSKNNGITASAAESPITNITIDEVKQEIPLSFMDGMRFQAEETFPATVASNRMCYLLTTFSLRLNKSNNFDLLVYDTSGSYTVITDLNKTSAIVDADVMIGEGNVASSYSTTAIRFKQGHKSSNLSYYYSSYPKYIDLEFDNSTVSPYNNVTLRATVYFGELDSADPTSSFGYIDFSISFASYEYSSVFMPSIRYYNTINPIGSSSSSFPVGWFGISSVYNTRYYMESFLYDELQDDFQNAQIDIDKAYAQGDSEGYKRGYAQGDAVGFERGKIEGAMNANEYSFEGLLGAVFDVPMQTFIGLFNFELLGINLASFLFALLTLGLIIAVIRLIL